MIALTSFLVAAGDYADVFPSWWLLVITLMSFLVAGGVCLLSSDHPDYPDVFPGGWW